MSRVIYFLVGILVLIFSCEKKLQTEPPSPPRQTSDLPQISIDNSGSFIDENGKTFFPWGFNYTNTQYGLIEDRWLEENVWKEIQQDFRDMKSLGANVVRIHLQYHKFMTDLETINFDALHQLLEVVKLAGETGLYLDITGLASYRKTDVPDWYSSASDEERWNTQKLFWHGVAFQMSGYPAVFAYNLMNEPVVAVGCDVAEQCSWLPGDGFGGFHFVQNISRDPAKPYLETMKGWIAEMTTTINKQDQMTPITAGLLALGPATRFTQDLDYLSTHIYPKSGEIEKSVKYIEDNQSDVPLVIEEIFNLHCTSAELQEFIDQIDGLYQGLMGHYSGKNMDELDPSDIGDAIQSNFLEFFSKNRPSD